MEHFFFSSSVLGWFAGALHSDLLSAGDETNSRSRPLHAWSLPSAPVHGSNLMFLSSAKQKFQVDGFEVGDF
jgi:hypothetical protein